MSANDVVIRKFTDTDYRGIVEVHNSIFPTMPVLEEYYIEEDRGRQPQCKHRRWVAERSGRVAGTGFYTQYLSKYNPHKFHIWIAVIPEHQHRRVGSMLFNTVESSVSEFNPSLLQTRVRADFEVAIEMLNSRGFVEFRRDAESHLDATAFDFSMYGGVEDKLRKQGIEIKTMRELESDRNRDRKLYDLDWIVTRDEPGSETDTRVDFEIFVREGINAAERLPDGYFVAVDGDEYVGLCILNLNRADRTLSHGITGVRRAYRRRGIALALKLRAVRYAKDCGYRIIKTGNEINNAAILTLNTRLGFKRQPDWIHFEKRIAH